MKQDFEDFLMERHAAQYVGAKDAMVDDCESWLQDLEVDDFIKYGDMFAKKQSKELLEACKFALEEHNRTYKECTSCLQFKKLTKAIAKEQEKQ